MYFKLKNNFAFGKKDPHLRLQMYEDTVVVKKELYIYYL